MPHFRGSNLPLTFKYCLNYKMLYCLLKTTKNAVAQMLHQRVGLPPWQLNYKKIMCLNNILSDSLYNDLVLYVYKKLKDFLSFD